MCESSFDAPLSLLAHYLFQCLDAMSQVTERGSCGTLDEGARVASGQLLSTADIDHMTLVHWMH